MEAKVTMIVEIDDRKTFFFERSENVSYSNVFDMINDVAVRAEETIEERIDKELEIDN